MLTLSLCQKVCPELIPTDLDIKDPLGDGSDGQTFNLLSDPSKVLKISALFCYFGEDLDTEFNRIQKVLNYLQRTQDSVCACVYEHKVLGKFSRSFYNDRISLGEEQDYYLYYYVMEKCLKLSDDEKKVFHTLLSHEDRGIEKNYPPTQIKEILCGLSRGLDFDENKVTLFCNNLRLSPLRHLDIHVRNIMKNSLGDFKLVDFDKAKME